jgi:hypothetical protein
LSARSGFSTPATARVGSGETVLDPAGRQAGRPRTPPSWGPWRQLGRRSGVGAPGESLEERWARC